MNDSATNTPLFNVTAFSFIWAISFLVNKSALNAGMTPVLLIVQAITITLIVFIGSSLYTRRFDFHLLERATKKSILAINSLFALGLVLGTVGLLYTSAINASFLAKFGLVATVIFAYFIIREPLTATKVIAGIVMIVGVFFLTTGGQLIVLQFGDIFLLLTATVYSLGNVLARKLMRETTVTSNTITVMRPAVILPVILFAIFVAPVFPEPLANVFSVHIFDMSFWPYAVIQGTVLALLWIFLNRTLAVASASYFTMMSMMTPVLVTVLAYMFLGESMSAAQTLGALLIIASGFIVHYVKIQHH